MPHEDSSRWFLPLPTRASDRLQLRLFCFPPAASDSSIYRPWATELPPEIEVRALSLPGRGRRMQEPPCPTMATLRESIAAAIEPELSLRFAFFGHSLGAMVAFEVALLLRTRGLPSPARLVVSGCPAPSEPLPYPPLHRLPDRDLIEALASLEATPAQVLADTELMDLLLPMIRADLAIGETYVFAGQAPLHCPISVLGGEDDPLVSRAMLEAWARHTRAPLRLRLFPGGHLDYLSDREAGLPAALAAELAEHVT
jgi:medium-chain acyl-[acyl-carrier-protein] hydrolase